ncbi:unnamed protein product [Urochloa decumbens]|uniref:F-box domain-containing protein n=1 Tax=Urochloa decumbens TaxID=240449 RepID=A0ABC9FM44_9POAL
MSAPPRPPPALMPELVEEILLRVPPEDPATLVRAALICKPWCRVIASAHFRRRLRDLRCGRAAPLLGFLCDLRARGGGSLSRFDPATDERREIPRPPRYPDSWKAMVLCAATTAGAGVCDHIDCHRGPFAVVFVGIDADGGGMFSCVYSSEAAAWSKPVPAEDPGDRVGWERSVLVGNALYFVLEDGDRILRYDLGTREISVVELPFVRINQMFSPLEPIELTTMEDGGLGFVRVEESRLCIWSRDDEDVGWALSKARKVYEGSSISCAVPYMNFCNPVLRAPTTDDGPRAGASSQGRSWAGSNLLSQGK